MKSKNTLERVGHFLDTVSSGILIGLVVSMYANPSSSVWPWIVAASFLTVGALLQLAGHRRTLRQARDKENDTA